MDKPTIADKKLEGKIAIVTGGASGIGEATARLFAQHGAKVVIADIQEEKGRSVAESIGVCCSFIKCDVSDEKQVQSLVKTTLEIHGRLDIMFSNAGIFSVDSSEQVMLGFNLENLDKIMSVNVRGSAACLKYAGEAMVEVGVKGKIICSGSSVTLMGSPNHIDYAMSKHALLGLVTCASLGLGKYGIRVNCVTPGIVATPLFEKSLKMTVEQSEKMFEMMSYLKNNGAQKARNIADAVLFLASDDSQFVTGQNLVVDGGFRPPVIR